MSVIENITKTCSNLGDVELSGIKLEDANRELLDITHGSLDQHVAMQPAAMSYYLSLKKMLKRRLDNLKSAYGRWEKKAYAVARAAVESGCTAKSAIKVEDVKARYIVDNEPDIENWEERLEKVQAQYDDIDSWCEGWKQKSFSMREYVDIDEEERYSTSSSISRKPAPVTQERRDKRPARLSAHDRNGESVSRVRSFIQKRRRERSDGSV